MSEIGLLGGPDDEQYDERPAGRRRAPRQRRRGPGCLLALVVLAVLVGGGYYGVSKGIDKVQSAFGSADDYPGPGSGTISYEVKAGDTATDIGRGLKAAGVVASVDAFIDAAQGDPQSSSIQAGFYSLKKEMKASEALNVLVDPKNLESVSVTIPEGYRVGQIVSAIVKATDFKEKALTQLLDDPSQIGLPAEADGNVEGYLYPATYSVTPATTPTSLLTEMVAKTAEVEGQLDVATKASALGYTPHQIMTVASILEYEANNDADYAKVARVIYNRLDDGMALQLDSTVSYVSKREGDVWTTAAERDSDSLYNTYKHTGLPPGPIGSPGEASIKAALNPAEGNWLYFVPDFESGTTLFTDSYAQHLRNVAKAKAFCQTSDKC